MNKALFAYSLRKGRGRNVRLRVTLKSGLEVVVPKDYDPAKVPALLERKKHWIRAALERAEINRKFFDPEPRWQVPLQIHLQATGQVWQVCARETAAEWAAVRALGPDTLEVSGRIADETACRAALARWLVRQTHEYLVPRLQTVSLKSRLNYSRAYVKRQKTRWASCSPSHAITLNVKLLFLPPHLVDYVMIHELCHLKELNHSKRFWMLVGQHCPDFEAYDQDLREMWKRIPRWAL